MDDLEDLGILTDLDALGILDDLDALGILGDLKDLSILLGALKDLVILEDLPEYFVLLTDSSWRPDCGILEDLGPLLPFGAFDPFVTPPCSDVACVTSAWMAQVAHKER